MGATYWKGARASLLASLLVVMKFFYLDSSGDTDQKPAGKLTYRGKGIRGNEGCSHTAHENIC